MGGSVETMMDDAFAWVLAFGCMMDPHYLQRRSIMFVYLLDKGWCPMGKFNRTQFIFAKHWTKDINIFHVRTVTRFLDPNPSPLGPA